MNTLVDRSPSLLLIGLISRQHREYLLVLLAQLEGRAIELHDLLIVICMSLRPVVIVKRLVHDIAVEQGHHVDVLYEENHKRLLEQVRVVVAVLVLDDVVKHVTQALCLIVI